MSPALDYHWRDRSRLSALLALEDQELIQALGGRRRQELQRSHAQFDLAELRSEGDAASVCRHRGQPYPTGLRDVRPEPMLHLTGGMDRLQRLTSAPVVAIVGSRRASDYGMVMARSLGRGLAVSGVTVASSLIDGIAVAAQAGALEVQAGTVVVTDGGLGVSVPARRGRLYERLKQHGCAISELPWDCSGRRWGGPASERVLVALATLVLVVEAEQTQEDLAVAWLAESLGRPVAAVPGRVTSPLSRGANALLMEGASMVRTPEDVLELLSCAGVSPAATVDGHTPQMDLEPRLLATLELVGAGVDTPDKLSREGGTDVTEVLWALSELEVRGLLSRGDGGRYLPRQGLSGASSATAFHPADLRESG